METLTVSEKMTQAQDFLPINGTDHIELYVGNAKQAAHFYKTAFGFQSLAYAGPETGVRDRASYVLQQDKIRLVLTTPLKSDSDISEHIRKHGDGVKILALWVDIHLWGDGAPFCRAQKLQRAIPARLSTLGK
jgi:4-hydroxyphenylpyruvate dioxygenase